MAIDERPRTTGSPRRPPRPRRLGSPRKEGIHAFQTAPYGWAPVIIMVAVGIVDRVESSITSAVLPQLQAEFAIGDTVAGAIPTAVIIAGALALLPAGYLADRYNRSNLIALVVFTWAILLVGTAMAATFAMFFAMRVLLGAADSIDNPASSSLLADAYPPLARAKVFGWARVTTAIGGSLGTIYGGVVGGLLGWRWAFALIIIPGLLCSWLCWRLREPARGFIDVLAAKGQQEPTPAPPSPDDEQVRVTAKLGEVATGLRRVTAGGGALLLVAFTAAMVLAAGAGLVIGHTSGLGPLLALVTVVVVAAVCWRKRARIRAALAPLARGRRGADGPDDAHAAARARLRQQLDFKEQLRVVVRLRTLRKVALGLAAMFFAFGGLIYWVPTLLVRDFELTLGEAGALAGGASGIGSVGGILYGMRLGRLWHGTRRGGRVLAGGAGLLIGSAAFLVALMQPTATRFALGIVVSTFFSSIAVPTLTAAIADVVIASARGIGFSLLQFLVAASGAWGPMLVGAISERTGSLNLAMYALGIPGVLFALLVLSARGNYDEDAQFVLDEALREHEEQ
jgi:MFS family permease